MTVLPKSWAIPGTTLLGLRMNWHWVSGGRHWSSSRTSGQSMGLCGSNPTPPWPPPPLPPSRMWLILMLKGNSWPEWEGWIQRVWGYSDLWDYNTELAQRRPLSDFMWILMNRNYHNKTRVRDRCDNTNWNATRCEDWCCTLERGTPHCEQSLLHFSKKTKQLLNFKWCIWIISLEAYMVLFWIPYIFCILKYFFVGCRCGDFTRECLEE